MNAVTNGLPGLVPGVNEILGTNAAISQMCQYVF